jgi:quinol monooxygenase YgiN
MSDTRIAIVASFTPADGKKADVERLLRGMIAPTRAEPGCRRYDLYVNRGPGPTFTLFEIYDDQAAIEAHRAGDYYKSYRASIEQYLAAPIQATLYDGVDVLREEA